MPRLSSEDDRPILDELTRVVENAWESGSPVASSSPARWGRIARIALRRWRSFDRRNRIRNPDRERRVEDLAKGLRDIDYDDAGLVGPLMTDYRWLAGQLAEVLEHHAV